MAANNEEVYLKLSAKIGVVGYPRYIEILKDQMTSEEAGSAVDLAEGITSEQRRAEHGESADDKSTSMHRVS